MHLYVHVPFCRSKCGYCGFASAPAAGGDILAYVQTVVREMRARAQEVQEKQVKSLFLGGGTPSLLPVSSLGQILAAAKNCFTWQDNAEITLEANPDSVFNSDQVRAWQSQGVNRISLGVQSLNRDLLRFLGRTHTPEQAREAVHLIRRTGMDNFGLDLIWGIPGQNLDSWLETVREALSLEPAHLSLYSLSIEPKTALAALADEQDLGWPDEEIWEQMFIKGRKLLIQAGFVHYEISNFARPGRECRHNWCVWRGEEYMGFGPSAVSTVSHVRRRNPERLSEYLQMMRDNNPLPREEILSPQVRDREMIMLGLRTRLGIDWVEAESRVERELAGQLERAGLIEVKGGRLRLTPQGMLVSNEILSRVLQ
ncbi:MAG: radical SAM family heme chaperone HemW [Desulfovermiculus sp.]